MPAELTSFVGRTGEIGEIRTLLSSARVVTLTGPGGVGKTRLALRVAERLRRSFRDGVCFIDLSPLTDGGLVAYSVGDALQIDGSTAGGQLELVADALRERRILLVLDNCERVAGACSELIGAVVHVAPDVRMLVTSRQSLGVTGEPEWAVKPLPVPTPETRDSEHRVTFGAAAEYPAVALFSQRAAAAGGFALSEENWPAVAGICRRLDGVPLALELAAGLSRVLSPHQIFERLDNQFRILTTADRGAPERHRSLRAAVDWSHELCSDEERLLWARSSVFVGWFGLDAAEDVCSGEDLPVGTVLEAVSGLVNKSILIREERLGEAQYRLLDTLAQYGRQRLRDLGRRTALARRHRDWYLRRSERMAAEWFGPDQIRWSRHMRSVRPDLRAALEFCLSTPGETQAGLRILAAMDQCWVASGPVGEGRYWLERALKLDPEASLPRAGALKTLGHLASIQADHELARSALRECGTLAERYGDQPLRSMATAGEGLIALSTGDLPVAVALGEQALQSIGNAPHELSARVSALLLLALAKDQLGEYDQAAAAGEEARRLCAKDDEHWYRSWALVALGFAELGRLDVSAAADHAREVLRIARAFHDVTGAGLATMLMAGATVISGDHERGAALLGLTRGLGETATLLRSIAFYDSTTKLFENLARDAIGDAAFQAAAVRGQDFDFDQAVDFALGEAPGDDAAEPDTPTGPDRTLLSDREWQVAQLVAQGMSNRDIATALVISQRTAEGHVQKILRKLGFRSRTQIVAWATGNAAEPLP